MKVTFGNWLTLARKNSDLTQADLADLLGLKTQSISKWERDKSSPALNPDQMAKLCDALGVNIHELQRAFLGEYEMRMK